MNVLAYMIDLLIIFVYESNLKEEINNGRKLNSISPANDGFGEMTFS